jgi:hypothetical protein
MRRAVGVSSKNAFGLLDNLVGSVEWEQLALLLYLRRHVAPPPIGANSAMLGSRRGGRMTSYELHPVLLTPA